MKNIFNFILSSLLLVPGLSLAAKLEAPQENFNSVLERIQDSQWKGTFNVIGQTVCNGTLDVYFFPRQQETFSEGIETVSYRHHADFSKHWNPLCSKIASKLSPVAVGSCTDFPKKYNPHEGKQVPFRTIIPREDGKKAFVNSPSCGKNNSVERQELELTKAHLSDGDRKLELTIVLKLAGVPIRLSYILERQEARE